MVCLEGLRVEAGDGPGGLPGGEPAAVVGEGLGASDGELEGVLGGVDLRVDLLALGAQGEEAPVGFEDLGGGLDGGAGLVPGEPQRGVAAGEHVGGDAPLDVDVVEGVGQGGEPLEERGVEVDGDVAELAAAGEPGDRAARVAGDAELVLHLAEPGGGDVVGVDGALGGFALEDADLARPARVSEREVGGGEEVGAVGAADEPLALALGDDLAGGLVLPEAAHDGLEDVAHAHGEGLGAGGVDADAPAPELVGGFVGVEAGDGADLGAADAVLAEL